ncbi:MAG: HigA family addiction module antitoxin [Pseudomonadota bacterium]
MSMHNPPHPGEFIRSIYLAELGVSVRKVAQSLGVSPSTFTRLLNGQSNVSPEMALRLAKALGRSPESWLAMQDAYDLWHARKEVDLRAVKRVVGGAE